MVAKVSAEWKNSNTLLLTIVVAALILDGSLVSVIVPILPDYLYEIKTRNAESNASSIVPKHVASTDPTITRALPKHQEGSLEFGLIVASKSVAQLVVNPFIGSLTTKFGCDRPLFAGFVTVFFSTLLMAFGSSYAVLLVSRLIQGVGSSFLNVAGLAVLANRHSDPHQRDIAVTYALGGLSLGLLIGAPYGGVLYAMSGKTAVFLILCLFTFIFGCLHWYTIQGRPSDTCEEDVKPGSTRMLLMDPYIIFTIGGIFFEHFAMAFIQTGLPIWMLDTMDASVLQLGLVFLPSDIAYLLAISIYPRLMHKLGRWLTAMLGVVFMGVALAMIPFSHQFITLLIPAAVLGMANGMVETSLMAELANLVDIRHDALYGVVYAIADFVMCLGLAIGPVVCGILMNRMDFGLLLFSIAALKFLFAPFLTVLKRPPSLVRETKPLLIGIEESVNTVKN